MRRILVVDDEENVRHMLTVLLEREGYEAAAVSSGEDALKELARSAYDVVLCDVRMPGSSGIDLLRKVQEEGLAETMIMMSAYGSVDSAIEAMKLGAYDYISKPFKQDEIILTLRKAEERERLKRENMTLRRALQGEYSFENIISNSPKMQEIFRTMGKIADYKSTVLITGESGTGKELVARALHYNSRRRAGGFVAVNCGAIPEALLESELFGHVRGAFTDASRDKRGLFEEAHGGTLFLDEIGELPLGLQVKLLRVLQEEEIRRVGDNHGIHVDVRIVAATVRDLAQEAQAGRFREDLFYRLNVVQVALPALRERREDIPLLVDHFLERINRRLGTRVRPLKPEVLRTLVDYTWPGNVRELENTIERAIVLSEGDEIGMEDLPEKIRGGAPRLDFDVPQEELSIKKWSRAIERTLIAKALARCGGNRTKASEILEISHRALLYKIKEYGLK